MEGGKKAIFAPQYLGSTGYYAALKRCGRAVIDAGMRYDKRMKSVHRTEIAGNHGRLMLTVPVSHIEKGGRWEDTRISEHGNWWEVHRGALESAYGRTPYFEYYFDTFERFFTREAVGMRITDYDAELDAVIRRHLGIETAVSIRTDGTEGWEDLRKADFRGGLGKEYYQVRKATLGFIEDVSVLDLLFNMGPEGSLLL